MVIFAIRWFAVLLVADWMKPRPFWCSHARTFKGNAHGCCRQEHSVRVFSGRAPVISNPFWAAVSLRRSVGIHVVWLYGSLWMRGEKKIRSVLFFLTSLLEAQGSCHPYWQRKYRYALPSQSKSSPLALAMPSISRRIPNAHNQCWWLIRVSALKRVQRYSISPDDSFRLR